ncbi:MAG: metallophosphoesterase family protein [Planctomycetota bacterium]|jgi:3',5'-cyclic AMP phosphodiesterase CpdA
MVFFKRLILLLGGGLLFLYSSTAGPLHGGEKSVETSRTEGKQLPTPKDQNAFSFVIIADRTASGPRSLDVLEQAVKDVNAIRPDFVITVGDLIGGYTNHEKWIYQMKSFRVIMDRLKVPWYPVAGNHDLYWRGKNPPKHEHEGNYEAHFGPIWYSFLHKKCRFIALCTDEGDPETGKKTYEELAAQKMSAEQTSWLENTLKTSKDADHVFLFLHIPRWTSGAQGADWKRTHNLLKKAGNVSAVFAGHVHVMYFFGKKDGIEYHTLACTGGTLNALSPRQGYLHHFDLVTVRGKDFHVAAIPVGSVIDPRSGHDPLATAPRKKMEILGKRNWQVKSEETRILKYPIAVPKLPTEHGLLRIAIGNSIDDTGDQGICYSLLDEKGLTVRSGFLRLKEVSILDVEVLSQSHWTFLLIDGDTKLTGKKPGNDGTIQIQVNTGSPPSKRRERKPNALRMKRGEFLDYLKGRAFKFLKGDETVIAKKITLHENGICSRRNLAETYWSVNEKGHLTFLNEEKVITATFNKRRALKDRRLRLEGKSLVEGGGTIVLEELE